MSNKVLLGRMSSKELNQLYQEVIAEKETREGDAAQGDSHKIWVCAGTKNLVLPLAELIDVVHEDGGESPELRVTEKGISVCVSSGRSKIIGGPFKGQTPFTPFERLGMFLANKGFTPYVMA